MKQSSNVQSWRRLSLLLLAVTGVWLASATQAFAAEGSGSCTADSEVRQLDYWLGHWTMKSDGGSSSSNVTLSLDKCMFIEHWENGKGHVTEKMFAYSPEDKNWGGMFADNEGRMHVSFLPAKFHRAQPSFMGRVAVVHRFFPGFLQPVGRHAYYSELMQDRLSVGTANWTTVYRAEYSRAQPQ